MSTVRVAIIQKGKTFDGAYFKAEIIDVGLLPAHALTEQRLAECDKLGTVLASDTRQVRLEAERTCREQGWRVVE